MGKSKIATHFFRHAFIATLFISIGACNPLAIRDVPDAVAPACKNLVPFDGGDGSSATPYIVCSAAQLDQVRNYLSSNFIQTADIDLASYVSSYDAGLFAPIGSADAPSAPLPHGAIHHPFEGNYDGQNYKIKNFTYLNAAAAFPVGLFSIVYGAGGGGVIQNVNMTNVNVLGGTTVGTGALVGSYSGDYNGTTSNLKNISVSGTVSATDTVGGIVGLMNKTVHMTINSHAADKACNFTGVAVPIIEGSTSSGTVTATAGVAGAPANAYLGGLAGSVNCGNIKNSASSMAVSDANGFFVGGLAGYLSSGTAAFPATVGVSQSSASGDVSGAAQAGGLIGSANFVIVDSSNASGVVVSTNGNDIGGAAAIGGLIGYLSGTDTISNSYATGSVGATNTGNGINGIGGLIGQMVGVMTVSNSYATGKATVSSAAGTNSMNAIGGLIGQMVGGNATYSYTISSSYATGGVSAIQAGPVDSYGAGGLIGSVGAVMGVNIALSVTNCFATGDIEGDSFVGGLIGSIMHTLGSVTNSFAYNNNFSGLANASAVIGSGGITFTDLYYRAAIDGTYPDGNATSITDPQFLAISSFGGFASGMGNPWKAIIPVGQAYPSLSWCNNNAGCQ